MRSGAQQNSAEHFDSLLSNHKHHVPGGDLLGRLEYNAGLPKKNICDNRYMFHTVWAASDFYSLLF
jgi:hypothetical protein